jgi:hypothetical protein
MRIIVRTLAVLWLICLSRLALSDGHPAPDGLWQQMSLACAEVVDCRFSTNGEHDVLILRPLGTLSGTFDSGMTETVTAWWPARSDVLPKPGDTVLAWLTPAAMMRWAVPNITEDVVLRENYPQYLPGPTGAINGAIRFVRGFSDPGVGATLSEVQRQRGLDLRGFQSQLAGASPDGRYWQDHSLVCAQVEGVAEMPRRSSIRLINLRPALTLSGHFDPGKISKISAPIDPTNFGVDFKFPSAGQMVLVVLFNDGGIYTVTIDRADFMPGSHAPICTVNSLDDPKVSETLKAVQKLRHATTDAKPNAVPKDGAVKR